MIFSKINKVSPLEHDFTEVLEHIVLTPKILYYAGNLPENVVWGQKKRPRRRPVVAIVGARAMTPYGREIAHQAAYAAAKAGAVVVSGLAYGIDAMAHRGALDAGGVTVAVLGTPFKRGIYPRANTVLGQEILAKNGAIVTEIGDDDTYHAKGTFLLRNRIISGLADVVLVVEAAKRSGALNTAAHALEQGKEVMAVPGQIITPKSEGCNRLIAKGAIPYLGPDSLLDLLFPGRLVRRARRRAQQAPPQGDSPEENEVIRLLHQGLRDGAAIIRESNWLDAASFSRAITLLEIKGVVEGLGGNQWVLLAR